jgi:hypothetical protein
VNGNHEEDRPFLTATGPRPEEEKSMETTATSWRRTRSSMFLDDDARRSSVSQLSR